MRLSTGFGSMIEFIGLFDTARDYILQFTITHTLVFTVTSSLSLFGYGFQRRTFPFLWVPELSWLQLRQLSRNWLSVGGSVKLLLIFDSTVIPGFSLLEIHDEDFCSLLDVYVFRNGTSSSTRERSIFLCCTIVSARYIRAVTASRLLWTLCIHYTNIYTRYKFPVPEAENIARAMRDLNWNSCFPRNLSVFHDSCNEIAVLFLWEQRIIYLNREKFRMEVLLWRIWIYL
jgi:hypothetical protein